MSDFTVRETDASAAAQGRDTVVARPADVLYILIEGHDTRTGGARIDLTNVDEISVGRGPRNFRFDDRALRITLEDPQISSRHLTLTRERGSFVLRDVGSTNGTFIGEERITERAIDGVTFVTGSAAFRLERNVPSYDAPGAVTLARDLPGRKEGLASLVPSIAEGLRDILRIAGADLSVLLRGESGTGKDVLARAIHRLSPRAAKPMVAVNCASLPDTLVESQLFGHTRGAFSGAVRDEPGFFRAADGGTLFLDEIGDMPPPAQAALLRALETREVIPVGSTKAIPVDVRVISATLRDERSLRPDLLARLAGYRHELKPLRDRMPDLGLLVTELLERLGAEGTLLAPEAVRSLVQHPFPLNVRELGAALKSAHILASSGIAGQQTIIARKHLSLFAQANEEALATPGALVDTSPAVPQAIRKAPVPDDVRREDLLRHLTDTKGNISEVARRMSSTRAQVHRWSQKFQIDLESFRREEP
ncbi:MAG: sigma 54-interacting transcriptional regulator [Polyangiaceae bacterium]